ncbi:MAG: hypothetical protein NC093_03625 [Alistipes sp.]|nr:hypothetical protein [Alistipes sp.]
MDRLHRLDKIVTHIGTMISIIIGIITGIIGMVMIALAYPIFSYITKKQREKIAPEILRLTEESSKENI